MGVGISPYSDYFIAKTTNGSIGYTLFNELTVFAGINMFSQSNTLISFEDDDEYECCEEHETESLTSFLLQAGMNKSLTLKTFNKNQDDKENYRIGIFPEINGYFNPHLNRRYYNRQGVKYKAPYSTQFAYGLGGGILYGSGNMYMALKYECNTIDNLEALNKVVPDLEKNIKYNHVVSVIFVFR
ncbi:hypothetical protein ACT29H_13640 [Thermophagus sp. OGC60D27]|uniref:hypothetical protein n=1 Tax=Thermophagus sp. OGC60D27 TaxID=3458415 RepID=UPI004038045F